MAFRAATIDWSPAQRRAWVLERLRETVRYAAREAPFYRDLFARIGFDPSADFSFADYAQLPVLDRSTIRSAGASLRTTTVPAHLVRKQSTGGSTGTPTETWTGPMERGWGESASDFAMTRIGVPPGSRLAYLWGHHLDPVVRSGIRDHLDDWIHNVSWYDCLRLSEDVLLGYHEALQRRRPRAIVAYASSLAHLADVLARRDVRPRYPTRALVTGAEKLLPHQRELVERVFDVPVHERYGGRDMGMLGFQVAPWHTLDYEIDWANVLVEPEDAASPSAVLVTKLHADAMPMLRYRVGDLARFPDDARPGEPALVLHEVVGREAQRLWLPNGGWFHGLSFPHLLKDFAVRDFQVRQAEDLSTELHIVPADGFDHVQEAEILRVVRANLPGVAVTLRRVSNIERTQANKWQPVVSAAAPPGASGAAR